MLRKQCFDVFPFKIDPFALRVQNGPLFFGYFYLTIGINDISNFGSMGCAAICSRAQLAIWCVQVYL
jgi:hypothetical protein